MTTKLNFKMEPEHEHYAGRNDSLWGKTNLARQKS